MQCSFPISKLQIYCSLQFYLNGRIRLTNETFPDTMQFLCRQIDPCQIHCRGKYTKYSAIENRLGRDQLVVRKKGGEEKKQILQFYRVFFFPYEYIITS